MNKPTTHVLMLVDDSGSMNNLVADVQGGFNNYIASLRADADARYRVTVAKFGIEYALLAVSAKPKDVPALDGSNYTALQTGTALQDAVGRLIGDFERAGGAPLPDGDRVFLVVQTDGQENSSREFSAERVATMIKERVVGGRWATLFLGAGLDAWKGGASLGINANSVLRTANTSAGTQSSYVGLAAATRSYAKTGNAQASVDALVQELGEDAKTS